MRPARAWVESPLQLLGAIEAFSAGHLGPRAEILAYRSAPTMATTVDAVTRIGLPPGLTLRLASAWGSLVPALGACWAIGDIHSLPVQLRLLGPMAARRVVLLDDGLATASVFGRLGGRRAQALVREHVRQPAWRHLLGWMTAVRLRHLARRESERVTVFTALELSNAQGTAWEHRGGRIARHRFEWLGAAASSTEIEEEVVVIGSALAADGLVKREKYYRWLEQVARRHEGRLAYLPHRREDRGELATRLPAGTRVVDLGVPVEMALRGLGAGQVVVGVSGTALATLPLVLGNAGARIEAMEVPADWWTERAGPGMADVARRARRSAG